MPPVWSGVSSKVHDDHTPDNASHDDTANAAAAAVVSSAQRVRACSSTSHDDTANAAAAAVVSSAQRVRACSSTSHDDTANTASDYAANAAAFVPGGGSSDCVASASDRGRAPGV